MKNFLCKVKEIFAPKTKLKSNPKFDQPIIEAQNQIESAVKTFKVERFFYRNAGLSRQERNRLAGRLKNDRTMSKDERALAKLMLKESPKNIPYERGKKILPRHEGSATPKHLRYTPEELQIKAKRPSYQPQVVLGAN